MTQNWIPVSERHPEKNEKVLVFIPDPNGFKPDNPLYCATKTISEWVGKWWIHEDGDPTYGVTHWMPLPADPSLT